MEYRSSVQVIANLPETEQGVMENLKACCAL